MILHTYGDSWTEGHGTDLESELSIKDRQEIRKVRNTYSWPKLLSEKLNIDHINNGKSGSSNISIFNAVSDDVKNGVIKRGDLVVIMWSSSLRDNVPFLPNNEWISWSIEQLVETPNRFINSYQSGSSEYDEFLKKYKEFFIGSLFNQNYYNIVNQNYIIFLQKLFDSYGIKHYMCDAFETMIINLQKEDDFTHLINKKNYWNFGQKNFKEHLYGLKRFDIWEEILKTKQSLGGIHPNKKGHQILTEELHRCISKIL
jgi:lysophospholipase L1-like esterase